MTIARAMMESGQKPEYTMVFCAWTAEEKGLIGSAYFADNPVIENIKCYMNYDMISRVAPDDPEMNKCDFTFTNTVPAFQELTQKHIQSYQINLDMEYNGSEMPVGGSDYSSFSRKGIPIFLLHGKFTPDYHQYTDHSDKAEIPYMTNIIKVGYLNLFELANNYQW
jgi:Zn-dependent M28 family amino/carboxypeptidase